MSRYPHPPSLPPHLPTVDWAEPLFRVHRATCGPVWFGREGLSRFDDPQRSYGVLYAGEDLPVAYLECVRLHAAPGHAAPVGPMLSWLWCRAWSVLLPTRSLHLVDLAGQQAALRIPGEVMSGPEEGYIQSQSWSRCFFEHPGHVDGILYRARHDLSRRSVALFGRDVEGLITPVQTTGFGDDPDLTLDLIEACGHLPVPDA